MLTYTYYAQNYAGIIYLPLIVDIWKGTLIKLEPKKLRRSQRAPTLEHIRCLQ
jgi:hypothetical protein